MQRCTGKDASVPSLKIKTTKNKKTQNKKNMKNLWT